MADPDSTAPPGAGDIAVVGVGCRYAGGVHDLDSLWEVLLEGREVTTPVPADRWGAHFLDRDRADGTMYCGRGGFLDDVDAFDARFFGVTPREAAEIDPQHRLLLTTAWEAMEDAGVPRERWAGSRTGVFTGILGADYTLLTAKAKGEKGVGPYYASGKEASFGAGRIAYTFGLHGPCMMVNAACASSLLAVHLACQALRAGECDAALAGGVNLMLAPELSIFMSSIEAMSPTDTCRPFDTAADGVVRGEGSGMVVLKRYRDALADGDRVLAVLKGSATVHDGRSAGLIAPSAEAQEMLLRSAMSVAAVDPADVDYVETHCTGTPLGDALEVAALTAVFGEGRDPARPLRIGSHKANFGHCDSAAGVLGLLKGIAVARHGVIPPQINVETPIAPLTGDAIRVATDAAPLAADRPRLVGVSAFGMSGTNVHVVLQSPPRDAGPGEEATAPGDRQAPLPVLLVSGPSPSALAAQAGAYAEVAAATAEDDLPALLHAASARRTHHDHRLAVTGATGGDLAKALRAHLDGAKAASHGDVLGGRAPRVVYAFSGQGSQWPGMAMDLYAGLPLVRDALDECDALVREFAGWSLVEELARTRESRLADTEVAQPAVFAVQVALSRLWTSWGLAPTAVVGHSVGEIAAAHTAGTLGLRDAVRLVVERGRIMQDATGSGRMTQVELAADEVRDALRPLGGDVVVATVNGPHSVVIAGPEDAMQRAVAHLKRTGATCIPLGVDYAFHSPAVHAHGDRLEALLAGLAPEPARIPLLSSVDPGTAAPVTDAAYWGRNVRDAVQFWPAVDRRLAERGALFIEIGPHPVLRRPLRDALAHRGRSGPVVSSLARGRSGTQTLAAALAELFPAGAPVDWEAVHPPAGRHVALPPVALADDRHWLPGVARGDQGSAGAPRQLRAEIRLFDGDRRLVAAVDDLPVPLAPAGEAPVRQPMPVPAPAPAPAPVPAPVAAPPAATPAAPATPADGAPGPEQTARTVGRIAAEVLGVPGQRLSRTRGFYELGFDSFSIVDLVNRLGAEFGVDLPAGAGLEHPSVEALTERILDEVAARPAPAPAPAPAAVQEPVAAPDAGPAPVPRPAYAVGTAAEPVAIVGMSCRLPGAPGIDAYWRLLSEGVDATGDVPADRWNAAELLDAGAPPGAPRTATGRGAFIEGIDRFDNTFFHVSAREARSMDPQQRIFLEVAWEALEDAGLDAHTLRGGRTGLFVGLNTVDYGQLLVEDPERVDLYYGTGNTFSGSAGRMSYFLGVRGPSVAVDTACASSLTAVHLGCQSLRTGESDVVVVGGANALLTPTVYMAMSAGGALAPDGRCKAFAASADGYGRGEGAGALVLKRLSQAQADGDRIHAVIRGSAVNHNGASGGLTVPSAEAQAEVIGAALAQAGVDPAEVDYVEAHGTGTPLGDPIELTALDRAIGAHRPDGRPLLVGSVKTNIAHLEAAAGVAGLIKTVLALREGEIPAHLHFAEPSPKIPWDRLRVKVTDRATPWPRGAHTPTAGVSAFGFTGTNAHVVLAQAPASPAAAPAPAPGRGGSRRPYAVAVSAADPAALDAAVRGVADLLDDPAGPAPADLAHTLGVRRTHLEHRVVATGADRAELLASLRDAPAAGTARPGEPARLAAVFGPDVAALPWQDLYDAEPAFRAALDAADGAAVEALGTSVRTGLIRRGSGGTPGPLTAPEAVAAQIALASLWADHGVRPEALAGRGLGEIAAAQVAGVLTLRDAMALAGGVPAVHPAAEPVVPLHLASRLGGDDAFGPAVAERLLDGGVELLVDAGLTGSAADVAALAADLTAVTVPGPADAGSFVRAAAALHAAGASVDWRALLAGRGTQIPLPAYPWQHRRHWIDAAAPRRPAPAPAAAPALLGAPLTPYDAPGARYYPVHRPAGDGEPAGLGAMAGLLDAAGREVTGGAVRLRDLDLGVPLVAAPALAPGAGAQILARRAAGGWTLSLVAGRHGGRDAGPVASAAVTPAGAGPETVDLDALRARLTRTVPWDGPQGVEPAAPTLGAEDGAERLASVRTSVPDAALDAAVDLLASCTPGGAERRPAAIGTLLLHGAPAAGDLLLHAVAGDEDTAGVRVLAADGTVLAELTGVRYEPAPGAETPADTALVPEDVRERTARRLHTVRWQPALLPDPPRPADAGRWLVAAATARDEAAAQGLAAALTAAGHPARALAGEVDWPAVMSGSGPWEPSAFDADAQAPSGGAPAEATAGTRPGDAPAAGVLLVAAGGEGTGGGVLPVALAAARAAAGAGAPPRLWLVTRGAQEPLGGAAPAHELAAAWGLVRVLAMEAPAGWGGCLDLPGLGARDLAAAVDVVTGGRQRGGPVEDELVLRDGTWWAPRLAPADPPPAVLPPLRFRREGWYVVAGALTAAVRPVVDRLVSAGARRLLVVRPAAPDGTGGSEAGWAEEMSLAGVDVKIAELPAPEAGADPAGLLAAVTGGEPVAGVVVAPVAPPVRPLAETGPGHLAAGAALSGLVARLEGELRGVPLDFFYVLGSAAAAWGSAGMAAAAAQDAAVAAVAAARTAAGGAAAVLRRMPGADTGELTRRDRLMMENTGLTPLTAGDLAEAAGVLLRAGHTDAAVALVDARRYAEACRAQTPRGFLDLLDRAPEGPAAPQDGPEEPAGQAPLAARLLALSPQLRADALLAQVLRTVTEVLGEASDGGVDPERGFFELGMDSVMAVALKVRLDEQLGVDLPATLTFEFPTARALARHLLDGLTAAGEPEPDAQHAADAADAAEAAEAADTGAPDGGDDLDSLTDDELMERLMAGLAASEQILGEG